MLQSITQYFCTKSSRGAVALGLCLSMLEGCGKDMSQDKDFNRNAQAYNAKLESASGDTSASETLILQGLRFTNNSQPQWQWRSKNPENIEAVFRYGVDIDDLNVGGEVSRAVSYQPEKPLSPGLHIFSLQELVSEKFWSTPLRFETVVDSEPPPPVKFSGVDLIPSGQKVTWTWEALSEQDLCIGKIGDLDFANGGVQLKGTKMITDKPMIDGWYELFVICQDLAGNASRVASKKIHVGVMQ